MAFHSVSQDRLIQLDQKLKELSKKSPGLMENVELSVNNATIQEFLRGLAATHSLNLNVDATLNFKITNAFSNVNVIDVLIFLCKNYELDIEFSGSIMSFVKYVPPAVEGPKPSPHIIKINYDNKNDLLSLDLKDDTLYQVAKEVTKATGKNIVVIPELNNKIVSGFIQNMSFGSGMLSFALANDLKITSSEDNAFLVEKKEKETVAGAQKPKTDKSKDKNAPDVAGLNITILADTLLTVDANTVPITDIINAACAQMKQNYFLFSEIKGTASLHISNATFEDFLKYLLNATDYTFKKTDGIYLFGDRNIEGLRKTQLLQLKYRTAEKIIEVIPADLKKGVDIKAFPDLNSVILSGSQPRITEIESFLRDIDRVVPVVVIEVLIVDIRNSRTVSTGIQAGLGQKPATTQGTIFPGVDMSLSSSSINNLISGINGWGVVNLGKVTPNFYLNIKLLEEQGYLKLRSTPKLATLNGHEAKLSIGRTEYYQESSTTIVGSVTTGTQTAVSYKPINADLAVTINPMVSGDEQITLDINVKQSNFTERISPTAPPGSITRDFQSMIRVKNEEMIILGGLEENTSNDSGSGVPFLSRIPVIKWFFSSRTKTKGENKLTIFIKPTVVY